MPPPMPVAAINAVVARVAGGDELLDFLLEDEEEVLLEAGNG